MEVRPALVHFILSGCVEVGPALVHFTLSGVWKFDLHSCILH